MSIINSRYGELNIIEGDTIVSRSMILYGEWAQHEINLLSHFIRPGYVVADVGAFIGTHARAFSSFIGTSGQVLAFEPRKVAFEILKKNAELAPLANVFAINSALGDAEKILTVTTPFVESSENYGALKLEQLFNAVDCGEKIAVTTLDAYKLDRLNFVKIDVEGMELDVLNGAIDTLQRCKPVVFAECNSLENSAPIIKWCQENNYQVYGVLSAAYNLDNYVRNTENIFGAAKEVGMLLIPGEAEAKSQYEDVLIKERLPEINTTDDLALLLLHKPQYPDEVLANSKVAAMLTLSYPSLQSNKLTQLLAERDEQIVNFTQSLTERDEQIVNFTQSLTERDEQIVNFTQSLTERDEQIANLSQVLTEERDAFLKKEESIIEKNQVERNKIIIEFQNSFSWRVSKPVRYLGTFIRSVFFYLSKWSKMITELLSSMNSDFIRAFRLLRRGQFNELTFRICYRFFLKHIKRVKYNSLYGWFFLWPNEPQCFVVPSKKRFPVDIVIPVHNGYEYIAPLFESIRKNTIQGTYRLIVIDDCSSDKRVQAELERQKDCFDKFELIKNDSNKGFIESVNSAVQKVTSDIFILLNTDVEVTPAWLDRITEPFLTDKTIASVTPFSNSATICSFPDFLQDNNLYLGMSANQIDDAFRTLPKTSSELLIPTGVGFCMAINRKVVKRLGMFDPIYGRGYCEENDWCMRTARFGYKHILKHNLFVYHKHGGSFPSLEKEELSKNNHQLLLSRYPEYHELVSDYIKLDPAMPIRQFVMLKLASINSDSGTVLIIDHDLGGGANAYRNGLVSKYVKAGTPVLVLVDNVITNTIKMRVFIPEEEFDVHIPDLKKIEIIFSQIKIGCVIYNNAVGSAKPQLLIQSIIKLREKHSFKLVTLIHDFYPICPSYTLLNNNGVFCGVPEQISICSECILNVSLKYSGFIPRDTIMTEWRKCWTDFLKTSDEVVCFSESSKMIILKTYPFIVNKIEVVPHLVNTSHLRKLAVKYEQPLHIGILGGINYSKGLNVVLSLVEEVKKRNDKLTKITVIGEVDAITPIEGLAVTGRYQKESLSDVVENLGVNMFLFPSICPETFSYVTSELIAMDVPLICFDIGAPPERVRTYSKGCVLPIEIDAAALLDELSALKSRFEG
jgi:FkbM family methyltransferase